MTYEPYHAKTALWHNVITPLISQNIAEYTLLANPAEHVLSMISNARWD